MARKPQLTSDENLELAKRKLEEIAIKAKSMSPERKAYRYQKLREKQQIQEKCLAYYRATQGDNPTPPREPSKPDTHSFKPDTPTIKPMTTRRYS